MSISQAICGWANLKVSQASVLRNVDDQPIPKLLILSNVLSFKYGALRRRASVNMSTQFSIDTSLMKNVSHLYLSDGIEY